MNIFDDIKQMHLVFGHPVETVPGFHDMKSSELGMDLIEEEYKELYEAFISDDLIETADAITDLIVVLTGLAHRLGIPLDECWAEVHRSNMAKAPGGVVTKREDGKVLKPEGWKGPNILGVLLRHGWQPKCRFCDQQAACHGTYEGDTGFACDECCGHGCEDGWCDRLEDLQAEAKALEGEG